MTNDVTLAELESDIEQLADPRTVMPPKVLGKPLGIKEKEKIEKLIRERAAVLTVYITELTEFAKEANANIVTGDPEAQARLQADIDRTEVEVNQLEAEMEEELNAATRILIDSFDHKLARLHAMISKLKSEHAASVSALKAQIDLKHAKKLSAMQDSKQKIKDELAAMKRAAVTASMMRRAALTNSFQRLTSNVQDAMNRAIEALWTTSATPEDANRILAKLPDGTTFRDVVSAERLYDQFDKTIRQQAMPAPDKLCCPSCKAEIVVKEKASSHDVYCGKCGRYVPANRLFADIVALPTLDQIISQEIGPRRLTNNS